MAHKVGDILVVTNPYNESWNAWVGTAVQIVAFSEYSKRTFLGKIVDCPEQWKKDYMGYQCGWMWSLFKEPPVLKTLADCL